MAGGRWWCGGHLDRFHMVDPHITTFHRPPKKPISTKIFLRSKIWNKILSQLRNQHDCISRKLIRAILRFGRFAVKIHWRISYCFSVQKIPENCLFSKGLVAKSTGPGGLKIVSGIVQDGFNKTYASIFFCWIFRDFFAILASRPISHGGPPHHHLPQATQKPISTKIFF